MKPGAKIFIKNKKLNKYLFFLRDNKFDIVNPNMWSTLGGGIEINESPEEALKREIKEESNIKIYNIQLIGEQKSTNIIRDKNKKIIKNKQFIFLADTDNKLNELTLNEGQKLGYFTLKKIKSMPNVAPAVIEAIDIYKKFLV